MKLIRILILFCCHLLLNAQLNFNITSSNVSCFGGNNGKAKANPTNGTPTYQYFWNSNDTTQEIINLPKGTYAVTVTDADDNSATKSVQITESPLLGTTLNGQPQICVEAPDGFSYAIPTGGTPPNTYSWSNGAQTQLNNFLTANTYTVTVTDTKGCTASASYTVGFLGIGLYLIPDSEPAVCPEADSGEALIYALSGNGPYSYIWSNGDTSSILSNVSGGQFTVTVTDVNGCSASETVVVGIENVDPNNIEILVPQCAEQLYEFETFKGYNEYEWQLNDDRDSIISGNNSNHVWIKWGAPGQKQLSVIMNDNVTGCMSESNYEITVEECASGILNHVGTQLDISPNPFNNYLQLKGFGTGTTGDIKLYNVNGKLVYERNISEEDLFIETSSFEAGLYILQVTSEQKQSIVKLLKI
ncbi:MAG: T9SS type A sorting domain-containing protein [Saprospiraceae bacterium]